MEWISGIELADPRFMWSLAVVAGGACGFLLVRSTWRRVALSLIGLVSGGMLGFGLTWYFVDVRNTFDVDLSPTIRLWTIFGCAGLGLAAANLCASKWWRKLGAAIAAILIVAITLIGVNNDIGTYRTIGDAFEAPVSEPVLPVVEQLTGVASDEHGEVVHGTVDYASAWDPPADMPQHGVLGSEEVPGITSGFPARPALVWLPPAALTQSPPPLPVLVVLSGQPGSPSDFFVSGHLDDVLDEFAQTHRGLAPIVVAVDQLSDPNLNTLCVDSARFGNSATYLTIDVPEWIRTHFSVSDDPRMWAITGFSQGGTCTSQLVSSHPELFGSGLAISSQLGPSLETPDETIAQGFGGSAAAYEAAQPIALMGSHGPYRDTTLLFGTGAVDVRYSVYARQLSDAADAAGMHTQLFTEPTGHDWHTVTGVLDDAFPVLAARMGIAVPN